MTRLNFDQFIGDDILSSFVDIDIIEKSVDSNLQQLADIREADNRQITEGFIIFNSCLFRKKLET